MKENINNDEVLASSRELNLTPAPFESSNDDGSVIDYLKDTGPGEEAVKAEVVEVLLSKDNNQTPEPSDQTVPEGAIGPLFEVNEKGAVKVFEINCVLQFMEKNRVLFEPLDQLFYMYNATNGAWEGKSKNSMKGQLLEELEQTAREKNIYGLLAKIKNSLGGQLYNLMQTSTSLCKGITRPGGADCWLFALRIRPSRNAS